MAELDRHPHRADPDRLLSSAGPRGLALYFSAWLAPVAISATANAAYASADVATLFQYIALYAGYWVQWAIAAPFTYRSLALFGRQAPPRDWWLLIASNAILLVTLIAAANLYFLTWNSFVAATETFSATGYWDRLNRTAPLLVGVHLFKYGALILVCMLIRQNRLRQREEDKRVDAELTNQRLAHELANARLSTLQGQLHPHFLFNALNCIAGLIETERNADAYTAVADLAALLRKTLEAAQRERVPLQEDVDLSLAYLRIAKLRFGDRISWHIETDEAAISSMAPPLTLQPLVENAVKHAVERSDRPVHIEISITRLADNVLLQVADDGVGFAGGRRPDSMGVGLSNLRDRLSLLYGEHGVLTVQDTSPGARVRVVFPYQGINA